MPPGALSRRMALWLSKPYRAGLKGWVDLEVWGWKLRLRGSGNLSEQRMILMPQHLDRVERTALADFLQPGDVFFDIGANAGAYSLWVASLPVDGVAIHAFEPDPALCRSLEFNIRTNGIRSIHLHRLALGSRTGSMKLLAGAGNLGENRVEATDHEASGTPVEMTTLPAFMKDREIRRIDALKIDIEGHECEALEPLFQDADPACWPRLLICELVHDSGSRLAMLLQDAGYRLVSRGRLNGIYRRSA